MNEKQDSAPNEQTLQEAIRLIKNGQENAGAALLHELVQREPENVNAWLWLANCSSGAQKRHYLERVLEIDPYNLSAHQALEEMDRAPKPVSHKTTAKGKPNRLTTLLAAAVIIVSLCIVVSGIIFLVGTLPADFLGFNLAPGTPTLAAIAIPTDEPTNTATTHPTVAPQEPSLTTSPAIPATGPADCIPRQTDRQVATVVEVLDGNTVQVEFPDGSKHQVRYLGINAPTNNQPLSPEASDRNSELVLGKTVTLVQDVSNTNASDQLLRYVLVQDIFVNYTLVYQGLAQAVESPPDTACSQTFALAEEAARQNAVALWVPTPLPSLTPLPVRTPKPSSPDNITPVEIDKYLRMLDFDRFAKQMAYITGEFGPRHPDFESNYIDDDCTLNSNKNPDGKNNLLRSLEYTQQYLEEIGYVVSIEPVSKKWEYNLVAIKAGSTYTNTILEVGVHIDSDPNSPGANDNASSVTALLEIATVLRDYPNKHIWRFVIFSNEEDGMLGSLTHTRLAADRGDQIKMALIMDTIGWSEAYPNHMNCIWTSTKFPTTLDTAYLFDQARRDQNIEIDWRLCGNPRDQSADNQAYWERGYPAVLSVGGLPVTAPTYHKCTDSMTNVDLLNAFKITQQNLAVLLMLDAEGP